MIMKYSDLEINIIASVCHEANRGLCVALGDDSQVPWKHAATWQRESVRNGVRFALDHPDATHEDLHAAWCNDKINDGWKYGPVKDESKKEHHCLVPYDELPIGQKAKDHVFLAIVRSMTDPV